MRQLEVDLKRLVNFLQDPDLPRPRIGWNDGQRILFEREEHVPFPLYLTGELAGGQTVYAIMLFPLWLWGENRQRLSATTCHPREVIHNSEDGMVKLEPAQQVPALLAYQCDRLGRFVNFLQGTKPDPLPHIVALDVENWDDRLVVLKRTEHVLYFITEQEPKGGNNIC